MCPGFLLLPLLTSPGPQAPERVGVFHRPSVVVAYYRSDLWLRQVRERRQALEAARRAGGRPQAAGLDRWGREAQRLAHRQLEGRAPIDNIRKAPQPFLPEAAARTGVSRVVLDLPPGAEAVDVTEVLLELLQADSATREIAAKLRQRERQRHGCRGKEF